MKVITVLCIITLLVSGLNVGAVTLTADFYWSPASPTDLTDIHFYDDSTGDVIAWIWYFGDGTSSTEENPTHRYADNGIYTVRLVVIDEYDNTDFTEKLITVYNVPPVANAGDDFISNIFNVSFNGNMSYDLDGNIVNWTWNFGDGNTGYGEEINNTYASQGVYIITLIVEDNDGENNSDSVSVLIDTIAPVTNVSIDENIEWYNEIIIINLTASDNLSDVNATFYKIDNENWTGYKQNFTISEEGLHNVYFYSIDNAYNIEQENNITANIDYTPPTTTIQVNGSIGENGWIKDEATIKINASDMLSGIESIWYKIDDGDWMEYLNQIEFSVNGIHIIHFYSIDNSGNVEKEDNITLKIDNNNPSVELTQPEEGYIYVLNRRIMPTLFDNTYIIGRFTIETDATDTTSGIYVVEFQLNGEILWKDYATPYEIEAPHRRNSQFLNKISVVAYDQAGHTVETDEISYIKMW